LRSGNRGPRPGLDDAQHRHRREGAKRIERMGRTGVACHDHRLDVLRQEPGQDLETVPAHRLGRLGPIGNPGGVTEVHRGFVREPLEDGTRYGEPAQARIEDADRPPAHGNRRGIDAAAWTPPSGSARIWMSPGKSQRCAETYASRPAKTWLSPMRTSQSSRLRDFSMTSAVSSPPLAARASLSSRCDLMTMASVAPSKATNTAAVRFRPSELCPRPVCRRV